MKKSFHRKVSPLERIFILLHDMDKPFSNQVVIEGTGTLDKDRWEQAVQAACEANIGSRLVLKGRLQWATWWDSGVAAPVRCIEGSQWDAFSSEGAPFLDEPMPFRTTHSCEVLLFNGPKPKVVFRSLHATMDGRGTLIWIEDIFRALRGEPLLGSSSNVNDAQWFSKMKTPHNWERKKRTCLAPTGSIDSDESGNIWKRVQLEGKVSNILSKVVLAISRETRKQGPGDVCFNIPVDMRRFIPGVRTTVNITRRLILYVPPDATAESIQYDVLKKLKQICTEPPYLNALGYVPLAVIGFGFKRIRQKNLAGNLFHSTGSISNLGRLPIELFHGDGFQAETGFFVPPGTEAKPLFVTLAGCEDKVEIVVSMPRVLASQGRLDRFIDNVARDVKSSL